MAERPGREAFTGREWEVVRSHGTPARVQKFLSGLAYNRERLGPTLRTFRGVIRRGEAHCLEAALTAAVILEQHGYPPLLMSLESQDKLDHVVFVYRRAGRWGSVARSRDLGLHGRRPVFRSLRHLAYSYFEPYVDTTARLTGYGLASMYELGGYDWRFSPRNVWKVERHLQVIPHRPLPSSERRYRQLLARYEEFHARHPDRSPDYFDSRVNWVR
ncbi:MAG TPA: hypothetical protein VK422_06080 [Pyrinomonadaceae bacterium]|nr:hypothetical protein [Pyrinomonadaceae bacterium]